MEYFENKRWLVKVPETVYDKLIREVEIGVIDIIPGKKPKIQARLSRMFKAQNFDIKFEQNDNYITFEDNKSKIEKVDFFGRFVASNEQVSDEVTKEVALNIIQVTPTVQIQENSVREQYENSMRRNFLENGNWNNRQKKKQIVEKKTRMPKEELKSAIFNMFNDENYLTAKVIGSKLEQPDNYLKEVLGEICDYIKTGPRKGCYELKRQFLKNDEIEKNKDNI